MTMAFVNGGDQVSCRFDDGTGDSGTWKVERTEIEDTKSALEFLYSSKNQNRGSRGVALKYEGPDVEVNGDWRASHPHRGGKQFSSIVIGETWTIK
jgi:hypothetical protein